MSFLYWIIQQDVCTDGSKNACLGKSNFFVIVGFETKSTNFSHVLVFLALMTHSLRNETGEWEKFSIWARRERKRERKRDKSWVRKSNLIFSFVFHWQHVRAWKYRGTAAFHPPLRRVRNEDFLSARALVLRPSPCFHPWFHPRGWKVVASGERRRKCGEQEKCEMAAATKISDRGRHRESCWRKSCRKAATELFNSRPVQKPPPPSFFHVPPFYSLGRFSWGNLISPSATERSAEEERGLLSYDERALFSSLLLRSKRF